MKRKRFTEEQIIGVLRERELVTRTADLCRLDVSEAKRLKQLDGKNARLKKLLADSITTPR
jgi:putative transposase